MTKKETGSLFEQLKIPYALEGFLLPENKRVLLSAGEIARSLSRVNISRLYKVKYWVDLPVLTGVHYDIADYLFSQTGKSLRPILNTYYLFEKNGHLPMRTLSKACQLTLYIVLSADGFIAVSCSDAISDLARSSKTFPAGTILDETLQQELRDKYEMVSFKCTEGDALLFSGSHCLHEVQNTTDGELHLLAFNFHDGLGEANGQ